MLWTCATGLCGPRAGAQLLVLGRPREPQRAHAGTGHSNHTVIKIFSEALGQRGQEQESECVGVQVACCRPRLSCPPRQEGDACCLVPPAPKTGQAEALKGKSNARGGKGARLRSPPAQGGAPEPGHRNNEPRSGLQAATGTRESTGPFSPPGPAPPLPPGRPHSPRPRAMPSAPRPGLPRKGRARGRGSSGEEHPRGPAGRSAAPVQAATRAVGQGRVTGDGGRAGAGRGGRAERHCGGAGAVTGDAGGAAGGTGQRGCSGAEPSLRGAGREGAGPRGCGPAGAPEAGPVRGGGGGSPPEPPDQHSMEETGARPEPRPRAAAHGREPRG